MLFLSGALAPAKINPVCTSHTDRVRGVDVLALPVAGAASDKFGEFLSRSLLSGVSLGFGRSRQPKPTQIKLRAHPLSAAVLAKREPHCQLEHSHLDEKNNLRVAPARQGVNSRSRGISVTILCISAVACGRWWKSAAQILPSRVSSGDEMCAHNSPCGVASRGFSRYSAGLAYSNSNSCFAGREACQLRRHFHNV